MDAPSTRAARMHAILSQRLHPTELDIADESARHAGHAGAAPGGETHYRVRLVSPAFVGVGRVARSRMVHDALREEFAHGLHALSLDLKETAP